jgi:hypothetical protein
VEAAADAMLTLLFKKENVMLINESSFDRLIRSVVGVTLLLATATGFIGLWGIIGVVPLATGLLGFCPLYKLLGLSSRSMP